MYDDKMSNIVPMMQDAEVGLILVDLEIPKDFSILPSWDILIADTCVSYDGNAEKTGISNLRRYKSSSGQIHNR